MVEPQYRPNLIQALTRSPFHPCSTWEKHAKNLIKTPGDSPGSKVKSPFSWFHQLLMVFQ